jgi:perosamine synthetase
MKMKEKFIPQFIPYWDEYEKKQVNKILNTDYLNEHKTVREFEKKFSEFVGARYCITCTSGTTALYLGLKSLTEKNHFKSINIPDYAGIFSAYATIQTNVKPILVDVGKNGSISNNNKLNFTVHSNGRLGSKSNIEDCAQAISHHTKNSISCYSFASTKHITTGGQGGAVCCDDKETFDILSRLKDLGRNDRQKLKPMSDNFEFWGFNSKFTEVQAAFGLAQLKKLPSRLKRLKKMYKTISEELKNENVEFFEEEPTWYIDMLVKKPDAFLERLKNLGIQGRRFYKPLHKQPYFRKNFPSKKDFKNSNNLYSRGIWLPSTTNLTDTDIDRIIQSIKSVLHS